MSLPLEGVKVLDLSRMAPGPFCTMVLGDLGADVLRVEEFTLTGRRAEAKGAEQWAYWLNRTDKDAAFDSIGRNKRSIGLNLKNQSAREIFYRLAEDADVLIEEYRPGVVKRLGIDYETIKVVNPAIIYLSMTGYGQTGPYRNAVGHDLNYISVAGAQDIIGTEEGDHVIPWNILGDYGGGGAMAAVAVLAGLVGRSATGRGRYIDVAMTDGVVYLMAFLFDHYFKNGSFPAMGKGWLNGGDPRYGIYQTRDDKYISISSQDPWFYKNLCQATGLEHLADYWRMGQEDEMVRQELRRVFRTRDRDEWLKILASADTSVSKVNAIEDVEHDPQIKAREMIVELDHPSVGSVKQVGVPFKMDGESLQPRRFSPLNGENTEEVLESLGYAKDQIGRLRSEGAIN